MRILRPASVFVFALSFAPAALAGPPSNVDRATARALAQEGFDALTRRDFTTAVDRFTRADALVHAPTFLVKLAEAQVGLGQLINAQETYNRILREELPPKAPAPFVQARRTAQQALTALEGRLPSMTILVKGPLEGAAKVTLDAVEVPAAALGVKRPVDPGQHTLRVSAEGFRPAERKVTVAEAQVLAVVVELSPALAARGPTATTAVSPSRSSVVRNVGIVGMAVGGAGLVLGAVAGGMAVAKHSSLASACKSDPCGGHDAEIDAYHRVGTISTAGLAAGGVLGAAGVALFFAAPKPRSANEAFLVPVLGAGFIGAEGRFQ